MDALIDAWRRSSLADMTATLAPDAILTIDSGGDPAGLAGTVSGRDAVAGALLRSRDAHPAPTLARGDVNGGPGIVVRSGERAVAVVAVSVRARLPIIDRLWAVVNPDKLVHWNGG